MLKASELEAGEFDYVCKTLHRNAKIADIGKYRGLAVQEKTRASLSHAHNKMLMYCRRCKIELSVTNLERNRT